PLAEGEVIWRSVLGKVVMENEAPGNPDCALARAKWDQSAERAVSSGRRITRPDPTRIVTHLKSPKAGLDNPDLSAADVTVFEFDLNGDGVDEIIFSAD